MRDAVMFVALLGCMFCWFWLLMVVSGVVVYRRKRKNRRAN